MTTKKDSVTDEKRPGIWFGPDVPINNNTRTSNEIFIHEGNSAAWSDGCIVILRSELIKLWNAVNPKDTANVTINVTD